jgi:3-hydroxybutyryl-CoA dehydratase
MAAVCALFPGQTHEGRGGMAAASIEVGETFSREVHFDTAGIAAFATACGDTNPLHHDAAYAATSRFGGIIACGPHVTSLLMALTAAHFARRGPSVGLGFSFRLRSAVHAGETVAMHWRVAAVTPKASLGGRIVHLEGEVVRPGGIVAVTATGEALEMDKP